MLAMMGVALALCAVASGVSSSKIDPLVCVRLEGSKPCKARAQSVLPLPLLPTSAVICPDSSDMLMSVSSGFVPKDTEIFASASLAITHIF